MKKDGLPTNCDEIVVFEAFLEVFFIRHRVQGFTHMLDCNNMHHEHAPPNVKTCTSVEQRSHLDYFQLLSSIVNINGKSNRETVFWNLPLSFVVGIDDGVSLRFHTSVNDALLNHHEIKSVFSVEGRAFNEKYPMSRIHVNPGQVVIFSGRRCCLRFYC
jgi:hypothetical protein